MMQTCGPTTSASKKIFALIASLLIAGYIFAGEKETDSESLPHFESYVDEKTELEEDIVDPSIPKPAEIKLTPDEKNPLTQEIVEEDIVPSTEDKTDVADQDKADIPDMKNGYLHVDVGLPGLEKELTQNYIKYYQGQEGRKLLVKALKNSVPYRPYVIESLEKNGLPAFLQYLPIVESDYKPTAISKSGATGIWQFMTNSMGPLMKKSKWHDDRRDPWLSTDAAMLKFRDNYNFFHEWTLAIAAYNCGAGGLLKIQQAHPGMDYWELCEKKLLKTETIYYVPKLIAVAEIVENAGYYGLDDVKEAAELIEDSKTEDFDYLQTKTMLTLAQLSDATGLSKEKISQLNMALLGDCTPIGQAYNIRLPKGYADSTKENLKKKGLSLDSQIHTVEKGDTLWAISRKYQVTVAQLLTANGMKENDVLSIGKKLVVPIF